MKHRQSYFRGFTLIELLVVIAIMGILAAISFPAITSVIARARTAKCAGNLRSIGVGLLNFSGDNNGSFPEAGAVIPYDNTDPITGQNGWTQQIEPYLGKGTDVYVCPDSSTIIKSNKTYSYFLGAHAAMAQTGGFGAVSLIKMHAASQHILAGDIAFNLFTNTDADKDDYTQDPAFGGSTKLAPKKIPIHGGTSNILFADGHVENLRYFDPTAITTVYDGPGAIYDYLYPK